ncbi:hypothetical protein PIROE2DRAFT_63990 [Piromyces sp. E2]|nr:hypothetical protein PIROE2DRAFT_63990 [Piromyces sp. E2]|eukprot:OUM59086.1 hypothetical protein PIROE2DRAFT_63990 [Piromyces sp. E2]
MNFASNKKKRLLYQNGTVGSLSLKKRKLSSTKKSHQKTSDRFNFFIDILNTNKKIKSKKGNASKKYVFPENKENNSKNIDDLTNELKTIHNTSTTNIVTLEDINNSILEDIENNIDNVEISNEISIFPEKEEISIDKPIDNESKDNVINKTSISHIKPEKYLTKRKILTLKEHKIIQRNIDLILNKENENTPNKIKKKEIDIVNQFQLNALGYINFFAKRRKELINSYKANSENRNIFKLDEDELERLIDQEWIILEKKIKNKHIKDIVKKQTKAAKKNLKNKKANKNNLTEETTQTISQIENGNENTNEDSLNQQSTTNIPIIPDSELIKKELKEYTEINLLTEMYNQAKQITIPYFSAIKRPPNPFSIYTKDTINTVIKKNPTKTRKEALKIVAKNWKSANLEEKRKYIEKSKEYKDDYEDLIKYAYLQRALIQNPSIAKLCLENQLKNGQVDEINTDQIEKEIDFKELQSDEDIVNAFNYIVRKFPKGYPLASPVLRFPERSFNKSKKSQNNKSIESDNEHVNKKHEKFNVTIKPKVQAFDYFVKDRYQIIFKSTPTISLSDLFDELEKEWKNLSYEDKLPYILLEIKDIKRYYMDECEISKERRGKKRKMTLELLESELKNQDIPQNNEDEGDEGNNTIIITNNNGNNESESQSDPKLILKPRRRIRRIKNHSQQQSKELNQHENSTLIINSEDEQENDDNIISLKKNQNTNDFMDNNKSIIEEENSNNDENNNTIVVNNDMEDNYIDSDTSEEYLAFDDVSRKFLFENYNEDEVDNNGNNEVYNFDIQNKIGLNDNNDADNNDTFIPVKNVDPNSTLNYTLSQNTIVYNSQNESDKLFNDNSNENHNHKSINNQINNNQIDNNIVIKSTPEYIINKNHDKSQSFGFEKSKSEKLSSPNKLSENTMSNNKTSKLTSIATSPKLTTKLSNKNKDSDKLLNKNISKKNDSNIITESAPVILETPPAVIDSSMKTISSLSSNFSYLNDNSSLETPKNSQSSKVLLKPLRPIRKSSNWKFGNDIGIIQQVSEEKINFISNKNKDNMSEDDDISSSSSSSSSEDEEIEEDNENNIFSNKENGKFNKLDDKNKENNKKYQSSTISKISSPIKYRINRRIEEEEEEEEDIEEVEESEKDNIDNKNKNEEIDEVEETEDEKEDNKNEADIDNQNKTPTKINPNSSSPIWSDKTKNDFNKFIFENSFVTPKKNNKFKFNYSSNKKKHNYYGIERKKYDLF